MADLLPTYGNSDLKGTTTFRSGTVGTSFVSLPASAGNEIGEVLVVCSTDQTKSNRLIVNLDAGGEARTLAPGEWLSFKPRGGIAQISIKGNTAGVVYEAVFNFEQ